MCMVRGLELCVGYVAAELAAGAVSPAAFPPRDDVEPLDGFFAGGAGAFFGVVSQSDVNSSCIHYNRTGETFGTRFRLCFDGDSLQSKNAY